MQAMWKNIAILGLMITIASCGSKKATTDVSVDSSKESKAISLGKNESLSYTSLGNDIASISLKFYDNETFKLDMKSLPEPGTDEKAVKISEKGTYTAEGNWKILHFKNPKFSVPAVFDKQYASASEFKVVDESTVKINLDKKSISIWGIVCERK